MNQNTLWDKTRSFWDIYVIIHFPQQANKWTVQADEQTDKQILGYSEPLCAVNQNTQLWQGERIKTDAVWNPISERRLGDGKGFKGKAGVLGDLKANGELVANQFPSCNVRTWA